MARSARRTVRAASARAWRIADIGSSLLVGPFRLVQIPASLVGPHRSATPILVRGSPLGMHRHPRGWTLFRGRLEEFEPRDQGALVNQSSTPVGWCSPITPCS